MKAQVSVSRQTNRTWLQTVYIFEADTHNTLLPCKMSNMQLGKESLEVFLPIHSLRCSCPLRYFPAKMYPGVQRGPLINALSPREIRSYT